MVVPRYYLCEAVLQCLVNLITNFSFSKYKWFYHWFSYNGIKTYAYRTR
uniref:Uncharacterized protein n=1 Tax=Myoviridae sp. ctgXL3 TaxID=2826681 RepID=A0A8S5QR20_9CAUD|nr:MAG TPA: hypothetical protein [Myoviridae sp. ctgXL3]